MTSDQEKALAVILDHAREALGDEVAARMQNAVLPGTMLADHGADLAEAYYLLCAMLGWTFVMDSLAPKHDILRATRALAERTGGPFSSRPVGLLSEQESVAVRGAFLSAETTTAASTPRRETEMPAWACRRCWGDGYPSCMCEFPGAGAG